ncbi:unnamed protein product [Arctogadus glacialis]
MKESEQSTRVAGSGAVGSEQRGIVGRLYNCYEWVAHLFTETGRSPPPAFPTLRKPSLPPPGRRKGPLTDATRDAQIQRRGTLIQGMRGEVVFPRRPQSIWRRADHTLSLRRVGGAAGLQGGAASVPDQRVHPNPPHVASRTRAEQADREGQSKVEECQPPVWKVVWEIRGVRRAVVRALGARVLSPWELGTLISPSVQGQVQIGLETISRRKPLGSKVAHETTNKFKVAGKVATGPEEDMEGRNADDRPVRLSTNQRQPSSAPEQAHQSDYVVTSSKSK